MSKKELVTQTKSRFSFVEGVPPIESSEKTIYKMKDDIGFVAAKIFRDDDDQLFSVEDRVIAEIEGLEALKKSPLGIYVPEFISELVNESGELIGMAVRWEEGVALDKMGDMRPVFQREFDQFEWAVFETINMGIIPDSDSLASNNILISPFRAPRLWIAEYELNDSDIDGDTLSEWINESIDELKSYIAR